MMMNHDDYLIQQGYPPPPHPFQPFDSEYIFYSFFLAMDIAYMTTSFVTAHVVAVVVSLPTSSSSSFRNSVNKSGVISTTDDDDAS
mmetsp:Transcript_8814/g.11185  ORF Transcript_8814/g.11185 Transcript_8814/m.11185 type:complete len:86 (-) Transcript_8814:22-279(-)